MRRVGGKINIVFRFNRNWERDCGRSRAVLEKFWLDIIEVSQGCIVRAKGAYCKWQSVAVSTLRMKVGKKTYMPRPYMLINQCRRGP